MSGPLNILIIEDEAIIAMELEGLIEDAGHSVAGSAASPDQALAALQGDGPLHGAFLDANLGGRSAAPIAERLRARGVPFAVVSGYTAEELRGLGFDAAGVQKPYSARDIERAIAGFAAEGA